MVIQSYSFISKYSEFLISVKNDFFDVFIMKTILGEFTAALSGKYLVQRRGNPCAAEYPDIAVNVYFSYIRIFRYKLKYLLCMFFIKRNVFSIGIFTFRGYVVKLQTKNITITVGNFKIVSRFSDRYKYNISCR